MKIFDLLKIAARTLKGKWAVLPALGIAIGMFCLCFAGAAFTKVQQEKSLPCELNITSGAVKLSDSVIVEISKISGVIAETPVLTVPVTAKTGDYTAELTFTGIEASYINEKFLKGSVFPESSAMPYIVLNKAACDKFKNEEKSDTYYSDQDSASEETADIDWLNAEFSVLMEGDARPVVSKVCGIIENEEQEQPVAYISVSAAKELLKGSRESTNYKEARTRVENTGVSTNVTKEIELLGLVVSNPAEEQQLKWDMDTKEAAYLTVTGVFSILCSSVLISAWRKLFRLERKDTLCMLKSIGTKEKDISWLFALQGLIVFLLGIAFGIIISVSLPSFLPTDQSGTSVFTLPIPLIVITSIITVSVFIIILPLMYANYRTDKSNK